MLGIGGIGVSALARLYQSLGAIITGCDSTPSPFLNELALEGISILPENQVTITDHEEVIYSNALPDSHPLILAANQAKIPVIKRGQALAEFISSYSSIAITGTHGKTTTTFMIGWLMAHSHLYPTLYGGGIGINFQTNFIFKRVNNLNRDRALLITSM